MATHDEVEEHVHHAQEPFDKIVAGTMAIIAAVLAVVSVLGSHFNTEKIVEQQLASDQWAYYQAKDIRRYVAQVTQDSLAQLKPNSTAVQKYSDDANRYKTQTADIQQKARAFEEKRDQAGEKAERFHVGEVFLEVAIVLASLAILSKKRLLYLVGVVSALGGAAVAITAYWAG
jgi:hypothetical protein